MGKNERQAYLKAIRSRYRNAGKKAKVTTLDEFCAVCEYHRKYAIRLLNLSGKPKKNNWGQSKIIGVRVKTIEKRSFYSDPNPVNPVYLAKALLVVR